MAKVTKIKGTRAELLAKLYEMLVEESDSSCKLFFVRQAGETRKGGGDEKIIVGVFRKVSQ